MGAGPLLPVRGIVGILRKTSPFMKMLDALHAEPALDGNVDTLQTVKVRGISFVAPFVQCYLRLIALAYASLFV